MNNQKLRKILLERITNISAIRNSEDDKYPISLRVEILPRFETNFNFKHRNFKKNVEDLESAKFDKLIKTVNIKGDYAARGNTGVKTLRLKINKSDWPDEWAFPESELDRRLFLQNFRLSNLDMITPYDEGGSEYQKLFPPEDTQITVEFEDDEESSESEVESPETEKKEDTLADAIDMLEFLIDDTREKNLLDISKDLHDALMQLARDVIISRRGKNEN